METSCLEHEVYILHQLLEAAATIVSEQELFPFPSSPTGCDVVRVGATAETQASD